MPDQTHQQQQQTTTASAVAEVDLATITWDAPQNVKRTTKSRKMDSERRVEYQVEGVGLVVEEWTVHSTTEDGHTTEEAAHKVFVDGRMVRHTDLRSGKVLHTEARLEPFAFLRYGAHGSTELHPPQQQQQQPNGAATTPVDKVPVIGSSPK